LAGTAASPTVPGLALKANASDVTTSLALKEDVSNKANTPLGTSTSLYPTQNAVKTYVDAQVAAATIPDANGSTKGKIQLAGDLGGTAAAPTVPGLTLKLDANQKGVANGVASLNASGIIPSSQLPPVTVTSTTVVGSDAAMIALSNQTVGSIAVRTDVNKNYVLSALPASTLGNWIELLTPGAPVQTVNGYIGTVNLTKTDLGLSNVNNTTDLNKPISTATQNALDLKANGATVDAALATKLSTLDANAALALKANSTDVTTALATKINTTDANAALALKANSTDVTNALATKLSITDANAALALKATSADVTSALATKLSTTDATAALALKANSTDVTTALATKINTTDANAALALKLDANKVAAANGVASLDALGKVPSDQIPAISFSSVKVLASEAEMLALGSAVVGSVVIRTDESKNYVLAQADPSVRANWIQLLTPAAPVQAVNGKTGTVSITATDLGLGNVQNTSDADKVISTRTQTALDTKVDKITGKGLSTNDYSTAEQTKLAAITGTNTGDQDLSSFATTSALNTKVDKVTGKDLSTNDYTTVEKTKLAAITGTNTGDQDLSSFATTSALNGKVTNLGTSVSGTLAVANGGTGATTLAANNVLLGNGTSAVQVVAPGTTGNVLTSNGTTWIAAAAGVPYSGATGAVNLGAYDLKVNNLTVGRGKEGVETNTAIGLASLAANTTGEKNTGTGYASLAGNTTGANNTATGYGALVANTTGANNTATGSATLVANTTGNNNTATGNATLSANTTGSNNTATGNATLAANTTGSTNTASGSFSLGKNQTGSENTAMGFNSLYENLAGTKNTGVGAYSLWKNTASNNTAFGYGALVYNVTGTNNVAQGPSALQDNTSGSDNTAVGKNTLLTNKTGNFNTAIGSNANVNADNLSNTIAIGYGARVYTSNTIQLGPDGNSFETNSVTYPTTAITNVKTSGTLTLKDVTYPNTHRSTAGDVLTINSSGTASWAAPAGSVSGTVSVANGGTGATTFTSGKLLKGNGTSAISDAAAGTDYSAGTSALGTGILKSTTSTGTLTIATAADFPTLNQNTTGNAANVTGTVAVANGGTGATTLAANNVLLGSGTSALQVVAPGNSGNVLTSNGTTWTSSAPSASGVPYSGAAGAVNLGSYELTSNGVTVGRGASSRGNNYAYGYAVLSANTTGNYNNAFGHQALTANTTGQENNAFGEYVLPKNIGGNYNTAMGSNALKENTSGSGNTGFGRQALQTNSTGSNNTAIGHLANVSVDGLSNATAIGNGATVTASNTIQLGNSSVTNVNTSGAVTAPIYASTPQTLTDAGAISWNPSSGLNASVTLAGNRTLGFSTAPPTGAYGTLVVKQDGTGGRTLTLPSVANKILGSSSATTIGLSTAANAIDIVNFYFDGTNYFWNVGQGYGTAATSSATNIAGGAAGSIPYQTAAGATSLLAKGTDGQILTLASGIPSWAAAPATGVTSVAMTTPTGLTVTGSPITSSGTLALSMATGYAIPATSSQTNWDAAYTNRITSASSPLTISSNAISLGTVPIANGGTNSTATPTSGGVGYGTGTAHAYTSAGTSGQVLTSAGAGAPTWSTLAAVRMNSDEFTATAAQTAFTFTTTSSTTNAVQTPLSKPFMYINGIRIKNAAFTWTTGTTTVTYVPANNNSYTLVAGDRIQFDYAY
jgi:hypothetical protein